jgi:outer membrane PBP1 activator LpoA protein
MKKFLQCLVLFSLSLLVISSCSPSKKREQVSGEVNKQFLHAKENLRQKKFQEAIDVLSLLKDENLSNREKAEKYNLMGIIAFQRNQFQNSKNSFIQALSFDIEDRSFEEQLRLNVASAEYKLAQYEESFNRCLEIDATHLKQQDQVKLYLLMNANGAGLKQAEKQYFAMLMLNSYAINEEEFAVAKYAKNLSQVSLSLSLEQKITELTKLKDKKYYVVERELRDIIDAYNKKGMPEQAQKLSVWLGSGEKKEGEIVVEDAPSEWERKKIGLVLPLTGDKAAFAKSVLMGLSLANELTGKNYQFVVRDSQDTPAVASNQVRDLVLNEHVSLIIGGLFSTTSQHEFRMSSKLSTAFISLAPVYLPREYKQNILFEIAGSVESQVYALMREETKKKLGSRFALFYSEDQNGQAYLEEFWAMAPKYGFDLVTLSGFPKNLADYRDYIKDMFGLKFSRERSEEYALWYDIRLAQFKTNIKRAQILSPQFDFDWMFITANPLEVVQIIPSFRYLEVNQLPFVGGPQWRSSHLVKNTETLGNLTFIDSVESQKDARLQQAFKEKYNFPPKYVESMAFDALWLAHNLLDGSKSGTRYNFKGSLTGLKNTKSFLSDWNKEDGIWMKLMELNQITSSGIGKL